MKKFRNKYRIPSARASFWDYSAEGCYFITICTAGRECLFGNIIDNTVRLSTIGEIVRDEWVRSFEIRNELFCDTFIIMPNHIHAILRIVGPTGVAETHGRASLPGRPSQQKSGVARRTPKSISSFVAGFKSSATKRINEYRNQPREAVWQTRFHDRIIRDDQEYERIKKYIDENAWLS